MGVKINTTDESQLHDSPEKVYIIWCQLYNIVCLVRKQFIPHLWKSQIFRESINCILFRYSFEEGSLWMTVLGNFLSYILVILALNCSISALSKFPRRIFIILVNNNTLLG